MRKTTFLAALTAIIGLAAGVALAHETGPHQGPVAEWGEEEYHVEVVPDTKGGTVSVYVYGSEDDLAKGKSKPIDSKTLTLSLKTTPPVTLKLEPKPAKDDPAGKSSVFVGKHDVFGKAAKLEGTVSGKVGTKPYSGDFKQK
ncbi:hypothetical protein [Fimbriiglobus ruber]|uniref:Uncharacterized protein n=1 Tax=Fimbriiglobus ruber TaxID=1908690 RepID=A0A225E3A4_9BACT|nr:hypothetical protein [Fimbriiglobus ruber]OWK43165.1 hypothetical protein FRUB_02764 [Fimbriiglobus ruber]